MKKVIILGSSGSIGLQTADICLQLKDKISVVGLSVRSKTEVLKKQIKTFKPKAICLEESADNFSNFKNWIKINSPKTKLFFGAVGLEKLVSSVEADTLVAAIVGAAALKPIIAAIKTKKNIALANKEIVVMAGAEIMKLAAENGVSILPVDSEHSAVFQCSRGEDKKQIKNIILTASGGPFYKYDGDFSKITADNALKHPTWKMGRKITIDSATLMNKGLEAIEASVLFGLPIDRIKIVIHPQSIIHSLVEYVDGAALAQLSNPDMRLPIQYALTYPRRMPSKFIKPLNLAALSKLEFFEPDFKKFPCLKLAYSAANAGGAQPAILNAANETAVEAFLDGRILFTDIAKIVEKTMKLFKGIKKTGIDSLIEADLAARKKAHSLIESAESNLK